MNDLQIELNLLSVIINTVIRIITILIFARYLLPLLIKEAKVKNGLRLLRYELLFAGLIIFSINTSGLFIILFRYIGFDLTHITNFVTYFNSFAFLAYALIKWKVYTQRYTPENKKLHEKFEKIENQVLKKAQKRKKK